jgi:hypothetical protein
VTLLACSYANPNRGTSDEGMNIASMYPALSLLRMLVSEQHRSRSGYNEQKRVEPLEFDLPKEFQASTTVC